MARHIKKLFGLYLIGCVAAISILTSAAAKSENKSIQKTLQPQGLGSIGIYALRQTAPSLTGSGVKFAVICRSITYINGEPQNDYRPNTEHNCLKTSRISFCDEHEAPAGLSPHSTAICSILLGEDANAFNQQLGKFYYQGAAPQAQADIYEFWHFLTNNVFQFCPPDADIVTVSIGSQFEDWWTRGIEAMAEHYGLIIVAGIGNGSNAYDPVLYPAAGANVIGVGVVDSVRTKNPATNLAHFSLAYPEHSSFAPTADGRCKPEIVAPGNLLAADFNAPNSYQPTGNWSSFSTPTVAGTIGLLVQKAKQDPNLALAVSPDGGNCVIKAILLNSATKLPYWHNGRVQKDDDHVAPLDYIQGAGMLNATGAYQQLVAGRSEPNNVSTVGWDNNLLQTEQVPESIYKITLTEPADKFITATLVWNRHYNNVYPFEPMHEKDANLRLELWAVDSNDPNNDYLLDYSDSNTDNIEHIYCRADANYTNYEIAVSYSDTSNFVTQLYGLAWKTSEAPDSDNIFWYDLNADGIVNDLDFTILSDNLITSIKSPDSCLLGDINTDGVIDVNDLRILIKHKGLEANWYTISH